MVGFPVRVSTPNLAIPNLNLASGLSGKIHNADEQRDAPCTTVLNRKVVPCEQKREFMRWDALPASDYVPLLEPRASSR